MGTQASTTITAKPDVPAGWYALEDTSGNVSFYRVDRPAVGRWAGYTFIVVLAEYTEHAMYGPSRKTTLDRIGADPLAASARYGRLIGRCGVCQKTLTDEDSRNRGIGPVCARRVGT